MPFVSQAQRKFLFAKHPSVAREFAAKTPNGAKLPEHKKRKKVSLRVNNKIKEYGNEQGGKIEINVRKHRGDKAELADTIRHEMLHAKHPKASEKSIQKKTKVDMSKMSYPEKEALTKKLRHKALNYKVGAIKRKLKMKPGNVEPGTYINQAKSKPSTLKIGIMGLV